MEKLSFNSLIATIFLAIVAFASNSFLPFAGLKTAIIGIGVSVAMIAYLISKLRDDSCTVYKGPVFISGCLLVVSIIVSTLLSISPYGSLFGKAFGVDTSVFLLSVIATAFLTMSLVKSTSKVFTIYATLVIAYIALALFHVLRFIVGPQFLSFGILNSISSTPIGSWYDLAIFSSLILVLSLLTLELKSIVGMFKFILIILSAASFAFLVLIGFQYAWIGLAIVSGWLLLKRYFERNSSGTHVSFISRIHFAYALLFILSILFAWKGNIISTPVASALNASYGEISLPWQYTLDVAESTIKTVPLFGAGPTHFVNAYLQFKPAAINRTQFWSVDFPSGASYVLSSLVTQGLFGFVVWVLLLSAILKSGFSSFRSEKQHSSESATESVMDLYALETSFFGALLTLFMLVVYTPSHAVFLIGFVMLGLFMAELIKRNIIKSSTIDLSRGGIKRISAKATIIIGIIIFAAGGVYVLKNTVSASFVQNAVSVINSASSQGADMSSIESAHDEAQSLLETAVWWNGSDTAYQALAGNNLFEINAIVSNATGTPSKDTIDKVSTLITQGIEYARTAEDIDHSNKNNYLTEAALGNVATTLHVNNGYEVASNAYLNAIRIDPLNPSLYLSLAQLDYFVGSTTKAMTDLNVALQVKPDYTDAIYEAGVISYEQKDYTTAKSAFQSALQIDQTNPNIAYLFGLTLIRLGDTTNATQLFTALDKSYPDNQQITYILNALKAGRSPFTGPVDTSSPEISQISTSTSATGSSGTKSTTGTQTSTTTGTKKK